MRCARLHLQERCKPAAKEEKAITVEKPRRYCQRRLVNPEHEEDPRWTDVFERFYCNDQVQQNDNLENNNTEQDSEDLYLTVQTLKFQGDVEVIRRPRTSFKYKTLTDNGKHRMFVKQVVQEAFDDSDRSSQLTCYYFDDYVKYLFNNERSRPTSGKSTLFLQGLSDFKENKEVQVENSTEANKRIIKNESKVKTFLKKIHNDDADNEHIEEMKDAKIMYRNTGKRKSLTISRAQSPETVQVIRVDVVCNYRGNSVYSDYEENKISSESHFEKSNGQIETINIKNSIFANKYLLTNTIKSLDEKLSGGAKVTLLCKTFKLSDRSKVDKPRKDKKNTIFTNDTKEQPKINAKKVKCKKNKVT